ncbi:PIN domain-like protein, partial [Mycena leptocephala]
IIGPAAETRSLLNLATIEGFRANNRGLRTLVVGVDASIRIHAIVAALQAANVFNPGLGGQKLVLEKLFYQLGNFSLAPLTMVWIFDGTGRPPIKRGTRVIYRPPWLVQHLKTMITAFGFYFYDAPGEAEAELAQLNENGEIDGIITEDSDAFLFGAQCVIRTQGPSVQHSSLIFTSESIKNTDAVALDQDGLILCALLLGGDYDSGVTGAGVAVARALAAADFGKDLVTVLKNFRGAERGRRLTVWRNRLRQELRTNSSGHLAKRQLKLADSIPDTFPDIQVADLYLNPLTSRSPGFTGPHPLAQLWRPAEPSIPQLAVFCSTHFGWNGDQLLKKLNSTLWPAIAFRMISSVRNLSCFHSIY